MPSPAQATPSLLKAIGVQKLIEYFEFLDGLAESGSANAGVAIRREYPGMASEESRVVVAAWKSGSKTIPAEDRACNAIDAEHA